MTGYNEDDLYSFYGKSDGYCRLEASSFIEKLIQEIRNQVYLINSQWEFDHARAEAKDIKQELPNPLILVFERDFDVLNKELYNLALDDIGEDGWLKSMKFSRSEINKLISESYNKKEILHVYEVDDIMATYNRVQEGPQLSVMHVAFYSREIKEPWEPLSQTQL
ncbi:MAG: hypothetical protein QMD14_02385 [Candidatus Aenigmarchaeota archaeon]|nr:hypothetical protein [Candidatus Aenigmarchaeota archaeon]